MAINAYIAEYGSESATFFATAIRKAAGSGPVLTSSWLKLLGSGVGVDVALRLQRGPEASVLLLLTSDRRTALIDLVATLQRDGSTPNITLPSGPAQYDELVQVPDGSVQMRVNHGDYTSGGNPLACDFRLYSFWFSQEPSALVRYQIALRALLPDPERSRRTLKYLAWLNVEQPFSPSVRKMQQLLAQRALQGSWIADEYLIFAQNEQRSLWDARIRMHFARTSGLIGFREAPLETGDFSDFMITGAHQLREQHSAIPVPVEGANTFLASEVTWLAQQRLGATGHERSAGAPLIFISYASPDFAMADATRQSLEDIGLSCWIAPRDINSRGLPYTEAISEALSSVRAVIMLLSSHANISVHVPRELDLALSRKLGIVPLRVEEVVPAGQLVYLLRTCQWLDVFGRSFEDAMVELRGRLHSLLD